jgi:hypothetical protein
MGATGTGASGKSALVSTAAEGEASVKVASVGKESSVSAGLGMEEIVAGAEIGAFSAVNDILVAICG